MRITAEQQVTLDLLFSEISQLKELLLLQSRPNAIAADWIPRAEAMKFLSYKDTQIAALEKAGQITVSKVGKRKFVHRNSIIKLIESNIQHVEDTRLK